MIGQFDCYTHIEHGIRLTDYESHNVVAPRLSNLNLVLCELLGLGDVQTMKVDLPPLLTILGQKNVEKNVGKSLAYIHY
jgi:hypothetical protein